MIMNRDLYINVNNNNSTIKLNYYKNIPYLSFGKLDQYNNIKHLFTTRLGGHSEGIFSTMNFAFNTGDNKNNVLNNFIDISNILNTSINNFYHAYQNHTSNVKVVTENDKGKGVVRDIDSGEYDSFVTNCKDLVLYVAVADCVPIYIYDHVNDAIGIVHAGWRGTNKNIIRETLQTMNKYYGSEPSNIVACIGPSICKDCYEVSDDLYDEFKSNYSNDYIDSIFIKNNKGKYNLDLWMANKLNLLNEGVMESNIDITNICTYNNPDILFSHRRLGNKRGNMAAFIMIV